MLLLARREGESIRFGDDIVLTVVEISGDKVRIGIEAPRAVEVHRSEIYNRIQKEKQALLEAGDVQQPVAIPDRSAPKIKFKKTRKISPHSL